MFTLTTEFPACAGDQNRRARSAASLGLARSWRGGMLSHHYRVNLPRVLLPMQIKHTVQTRLTWNYSGHDLLLTCSNVSLTKDSAIRNLFAVIILAFSLGIDTASRRSANDTVDCIDWTIYNSCTFYRPVSSPSISSEKTSRSYIA